MVDPPIKRIELYLKGLGAKIQSYVTSANLATIQDVTHLAHRLTDQAVEQNRLPSCIIPITIATTSATASSKGSATVQSQA